MLIRLLILLDPCQGLSWRGANGATDPFQILAKHSVFIATVKINEKRNFETPSKMIILCEKSREFYCVT